MKIHTTNELVAWGFDELLERVRELELELYQIERRSSNE